MRRVSLVGVSGSGKTTSGVRLASSMGVPFIELDEIFYQGGWDDLAVEEFRARVSDAVSADGWVIDGNYAAVGELIWQRADTVVWFDLPRPTVMRRVV